MPLLLAVPQAGRRQKSDFFDHFAAEKYLVPSDWWLGDQAFRGEYTPSVCFADSSPDGGAKIYAV